MSTNLTKREIVLQIYEKTGFPQKEVQTTVQMTLDIIMNALAAARNVELRNFGVLEVQVRKARVGRNPNDCEVLFVQKDLPPDNRRVSAKACLPQVVADHHHRMTARILIFVGAERPP